MQKILTVSLDSKHSDEKKQVIVFDGDFDKAGFSEVSTELSGFVDGLSTPLLVFDFSSLKFINSEGIGYLMETHSGLIKKDKSLVLIGVNAHVSDVFETVGLAEIVSIYSSLSDIPK